VKQRVNYDKAVSSVRVANFIKNSTEYPPACWRDESGSPKGEAKVFA